MLQNVCLVAPEQGFAEAPPAYRKDNCEQDDDEQCNTGVDNAMNVLMKKEKNKIKAAITNLKKQQVVLRDYKEIVRLFGIWLEELQGDNPDFVTIGKALINWHREHMIRDKKFAPTIMTLAVQLIEREDVLVDDEALNTVKNLLKLILVNAGTEQFLKHWAADLDKRGLSIDNKILGELISDWTRMAKRDDKGTWECFMRKYVKKAKVYRTTTPQTCQMTWEDVKPIREVRKVIVWNGNELRARCSATRELENLVHVTIPDVLCFLESKVNDEKMMKLPDFEQWTESTGFRHVFSYWSQGEMMNRDLGMKGLYYSAKQIAV